MVAEVASIEVTLRLLGVDTFQAGMRNSGSITEQTGQRVTRSMDSITGSTQRLAKAGEGVMSLDPILNRVGLAAGRAEASIGSLAKITSVLNASVAGLATGAAANALKSYADTATTIQNRLAVVVPVQKDRATIEDEIYKTAQRTRTSYEATASIFSRLSLSSSELGASQAQVLRVVETTQKALQAGGATAAESASIATQLSQALGSGRLQGDELRSISENSPVLFQAIAREFGVATGRLKDLGSEGKLTSDKVFQGILKAGDEVDEVFARTKPTIAAGIQQIDNALVRYLGNVDKSLSATTRLSQGLEFVAKNLNTIGDSAALAVAALAGPIAGRLLTGAGSRVAAPYRAASQEAAGGVGAAETAAEAARLARVEARQQYDRARGALSDLDAQPRFRQASPDLQTAYTRQAQTADRLREAAGKASEKEAAALLKRADAETVVASISETASNRVISARDTLAKRETALNDLIAKRPALEQAAASAGVNVNRRQQGGYYDALYKVVEQRDKLAATNATIALTKRNIEALDEAIARERSAKTPSDFLPQAMSRRQAEVDRLPGLTSQRDAIGKDLNDREKALVAAEQKIGDAQATERQKAGQRLADIDNQISKARASVAGAAEKVSDAEVRANDTLIASAQKRAQVQADLDAKAIAATAQRRAAEQAYGEAQSRLGGLAGQVGGSAATQRAAAVQAVATAESVLTRALYQEEEALSRVQFAGKNASAVKVALAGTANAAKAAIGGLVGVLGGPFGAALTFASVGLIGYELYQSRAAAAVEEHAAALGRLSARLVELRNQQAQGQKRSDREAATDLAESQDARASLVDKRNALLSSYRRAEFKSDQASDLGGGIQVQSPLDKAAATVGVNLSKVLNDLRSFPAESEESIRAAQQLADVMAEIGKDNAGYSAISRDLTKIADDYSTAARAANEFEAARKQAATNKVDPGFKPGSDDIGAAIDAAASAGRDVADAFSQNLGDRIKTGTELTEAIQKEGEDAKTAFERALGDIDTETLRNALTAVGSNLDDVKKNLDGTKIASGEATVASIALAKGMDLLSESRPDLSGAIAEVTRYANALRAAIGLSTIAANTTLTGDEKVAAEAKQRDQSLKSYEDRLQRADKSPEARQVRIRRDLPGLTDSEVAKLDAAENPAKAGRKPAKTQDERDAEKLEKKLRELDQDAKVSGLDTFDQKTVRFAQDAKVATDQIEAFIKGAQSGDLSNLPPVMQQIYDKMKLLEGVKLARTALDEIFPARKLARELEELRAAANASPEIAANIGLIEMHLRANNASEFTKGLASGFTDMAKSIANGTATAAQALETFKKKIIDLALDAAFAPLQTMLKSLFGQTFSFGTSSFGLGNIFGGGSSGGSPTGGVSLLGPGFATGVTALGVIEGPGTGTSDSIMARVSKGETILTAEETRRNMPAIRAIKGDKFPRFAEGVLAYGASSMPSDSMMMQQIAGSASAQAGADGATKPLALHLHGGSDRPRAETTSAPGGPRMDVYLDKQMAAMLMGGPETRAALKNYGIRPTGK